MNNNIVAFFIATFFCLSLSVKAQVPIDSIPIINIKNIKNQPYLIYAEKVNCDSTTGTTLEERICANLELQKQDSLLQIELSALMTEMQSPSGTTSIKQIKISQDIWERYRYSHCRSCIIEGNRFDMILFMKCATELTIQRREAINRLCNYYY